MICKQPRRFNVLPRHVLFIAILLASLLDAQAVFAWVGAASNVYEGSNSESGDLQLYFYGEAWTDSGTVTLGTVLRTPSGGYIAGDGSSNDGWTSKESQTWVSESQLLNEPGDYYVVAEAWDYNSFVGCVTTYINLGISEDYLEMNTGRPCGSSGDFIWEERCSHDCTGEDQCASSTPYYQGNHYKIRTRPIITTYFRYCLSSPYRLSSVPGACVFFNFL